MTRSRSILGTQNKSRLTRLDRPSTKKQRHKHNITFDNGGREREGREIFADPPKTSSILRACALHAIIFNGRREMIRHGETKW